RQGGRWEVGSRPDCRGETAAPGPRQGLLDRQQDWPRLDAGVGINDIKVDGWPVKQLLTQIWTGRATVLKTGQRTPNADSLVQRLTLGYVKFAFARAPRYPKVSFFFGGRRSEGHLYDALPEYLTEEDPLILVSGGNWRATVWLDLSDERNPGLKGEIVAPEG